MATVTNCNLWIFTMALYFQKQGPYLCTQPVQIDRAQYVRILHDSLKQLHDYAREHLGLGATDFHEGNDTEPCCYLLPMRLQSFAARNNCTPLALLDPHLRYVSNLLIIQLGNNPEMGLQFAENLDREESEAIEAEAQAKADEKVRRLAWLSGGNRGNDAAVRAAKAKRDEKYAAYRKEFG